MKACKTLSFFSSLHSFIYMVYHFFSSTCVSHFFLFAVFETCHHWALSPQLLSTSFLFSSVNSAVLGTLLKVFWNLCLSFNGNTVYIFVYHFFFLLDGFQEEEKNGIMVTAEAPIYKYKIFTQYENMKWIFPSSQWAF